MLNSKQKVGIYVEYGEREFIGSHSTNCIGTLEYKITMNINDSPVIKSILNMA